MNIFKTHFRLWWTETPSSMSHWWENFYLGILSKIVFLTMLLDHHLWFHLIYVKTVKRQFSVASIWKHISSLISEREFILAFNVRMPFRSSLKILRMHTSEIPSLVKLCRSRVYLALESWECKILTFILFAYLSNLIQKSMQSTHCFCHGILLLILPWNTAKFANIQRFRIQQYGSK